MRLNFSYPIGCDASDLWQKISHFEDPLWIKAGLTDVKTHGEGAGMTREIHWESFSSPSVHQLEELDNEERRMVFSVLETPTHLLAGAKVALTIVPIMDGLSDIRAVVDLPLLYDEYYEEVYEAVLTWADLLSERLEMSLGRVAQG